MRVTTEQLNAAAKLLGTTDKNVVYSAIITTLVREGMDVQDAINALFGPEGWSTMSGAIYDALRAA